MMLERMKANGSSWCACCGKVPDPGADMVKVTMSGTSRYILANHLVSWAANSGPGEKLPLTKKPQHFEALTKEEHAERQRVA